MNKTELTEQLAKKTGLSKAAAKRAVDALFSTAPREGIIASAVSKGDRVQITGFGTFERRARKKRMGRNPQTGATINIPARNVVKFTVGKALKDLSFPKGVLVLCIMRSENVLIPAGNDVIESGDRLFILSLTESIPEVERMLSLGREKG